MGEDEFSLSREEVSRIIDGMQRALDQGAYKSFLISGIEHYANKFFRPLNAILSRKELRPMLMHINPELDQMIEERIKNEG